MSRSRLLLRALASAPEVMTIFPSGASIISPPAPQVAVWSWSINDILAETLSPMRSGCLYIDIDWSPDVSGPNPSIEPKAQPAVALILANGLIA